MTTLRVVQAAARAHITLARLLRRPASPAAQALAEDLHEWRCPACGATTRARMADR